MKAPTRARRGNLVAAATPKPTMRRVVAYTVDCPSCGQPAGSHCVALGYKGATAGAATGPHPTRRRIATRRDNQARDLAGTLSPVTRQPGTMETPSGGHDCSDCGLHIKLTPNGLRVARHTSEGQSTVGAGFKVACPGSGLIVRGGR